MTSKSETVADFTDIESTLDRYHDAVARNRGGRLEAIAAAIDGGHALNRLREQSQHGDWEGWVKREGQTMRTAHNWRKLAETGLTAEQVVEQGGMVAVLRARNATRPKDEHDEIDAATHALARQLRVLIHQDKLVALEQRLTDWRAIAQAEVDKYIGKEEPRGLGERLWADIGVFHNDTHEWWDEEYALAGKPHVDVHHECCPYSLLYGGD